MEKLRKEGLEAIQECTNLAELSNVRNAYLSKKGLVSLLMLQMKDLPVAEKPIFGAKVNELKQKLETAFRLILRYPQAYHE